MKCIYIFACVLILLSACKPTADKKSSISELTMKESASLVDSVVDVPMNPNTSDLDRLFPNCKLPISFNYEYVMELEEREDKTIIPNKFLPDSLTTPEGEVPMTIYYAFAKTNLKNSQAIYLVITGMNPELPMDLFFVSISSFTEENGKLANEKLLAKYHAYSMIKEEYYCAIDEYGEIKQSFEYSAENDGKNEIYEKGDTIFNLFQ